MYTGCKALTLGPAASAKASTVITEELFRIGDTAVSFVTLGTMLLTFVSMLALSWVLRAGLRRALSKGRIDAAGAVERQELHARRQLVPRQGGGRRVVQLGLEAGARGAGADHRGRDLA